MTDAILYDAVRTPRGKGKAGGALAGVGPHELVAQLVAGLRDRVGAAALDAARSMTLGCVGQVGAQGGNIALVSRMAADLPDTIVATTINNYCASSLSAIGRACAGLPADEPGLALAGGVESMSAVPFLSDGASFYSDPLATALRFVPVALAADRLATVHGLSRAELDEVTLESHRRAAAAWSADLFSGAVISVRGAGGEVLCDRDELVRPDLDAEKLATLPPAFAELGARGYDDIMLASTPGLDAIDHVHTVAHCPGICDGAGLALVGNRSAAGRYGLRPRARVLAFAEAAADRIEQLTAGNTAMDRALAMAGMSERDCGRIEYMEAFAAVPALYYRERQPDRDRVNVNGGHLAMGHPMGASGAILVSQLLDVMERDDVETGLVIAHGGTGVGAAMVVQRLS